MRTVKVVGTYISTAVLALTVLTLIASAPLELISLHSAQAQVVPAPNEAQIVEQENRLKQELEAVLKEIDAQRAILQQEQAKGSTYAGELAKLTAQIKLAQSNIRAKEIAITGIGKDINSKTSQIQTLSSRVEKNHDSLAQLMRKTDQMDDFSLSEVVLSNQNFSDFFQDFDSYHFIKQSLNQTLTDIKENKQQTEAQRAELDKKRLQEIDEKVSIEGEKRKIEVAETEKKRLLNLSKQQQANYQSQINVKNTRVAQIRNALFALRDTSSIPFGTALEYANEASKVTGVRPAFILAILKQESDLGKNVGRCNRPGDPVEKQWRNIMKPTRDIEPFIRITTALGIDPETQPLSCPLGSGYGGAMGPSQFIPSTWEMYAPRIARATGADVANPWNARHAIFATAIYMSDLGATAQTFTAERTAALRYYAGGNWSLPANAFYGNQVMAKAQEIQETMIDVIQGN
ncbi:MAG TPA: lytic murein transglycosylase [Candidatus Paceibacterota bacterium]|nr:lytic murein transglycosylase [Candidatus Paceibacterota bacterium]